MLPRVKAVNHIQDYVLELEFTDGVVKQIDFRDRIMDRGGMFSALEDIAAFKQVRVDADAGTIVWPSGVDFCPDVLWHEATDTPLTK